MKLTTTFFTLSLALNALATPLGSHAVFRRHTGVPANNARRYILQSRMDAPPACAAKASAISNSTDIPDLSNSTVTDSALGNTDTTGNSTDTSTINTTGNSTDTSTTGTAGNLSNSTTIDPTANAPADNSTVPDASNSTTLDASNSTDSSTTRRRRGIIGTSSGISTTTTTAVTLDVVDLAFEWQSLCLVSGVDIFLDSSPCIQLAGVHGFNALLADADPCAQQTFADSIITFAKSPGIVNKADLIAFATKYRRHPRAAVNILGVLPSSLYCMQAPINPELTGIINAQPGGVNPGLFGSPNDPVVPFGSEGTCPLGTTADVSTCSCIPDSTSSADASTLSGGSSDNSTITDPPATASADSSLTDLSATATSSVDGSTATDAAVSTNNPTATDSAVSDAAAPTDSASADGSATDSSSTPTGSSTTPAATDSSSDISGNVNDPNGRRK